MLLRHSSQLALPLLVCFFWWFACSSSFLSFASLTSLQEQEEILEDGAYCNSLAVNKANREHLYVLFEELANVSFFRLFRVSVDHDECPLRSGNYPKQPEEEEECQAGGAPGDEQHSICSVSPEEDDNKNQQPVVDRTISHHESVSLLSDKDEALCEESKMWFDICEGLVSHKKKTIGPWINLKLNPERHTGYNGSLVWKAIYENACFDNVEGECMEERVLTRLLSGLHASINTHICLNYSPPPPSRNRTRNNNNKVGAPIRKNSWMLLRALHKASDYFATFSYRADLDKQEDVKTTLLVKRLLESHLLNSCGSVFDSFDETKMFQLKNNVRLKMLFKESFQNISKIFNCVTCQKCKLHGKLQLAGIGTGLKILFSNLKDLKLEREEVVAFFNTLHKFSDAIHHADVLANEYYSNKLRLAAAASAAPSSSSVVLKIASLRKQTLLNDLEEETLLGLVFDTTTPGANKNLLDLFEAYYSEDEKLSKFLKRFVVLTSEEKKKKVIIVGSGLAGSSLALSLLQRPENDNIIVHLYEKQPYLGGNSVYASSGINAVDEESARLFNDSVEIFANDMALSSNKGAAFANSTLVQILTRESELALRWIRTELNLPFEKTGQLGGHSKPRTHRPEFGLAGAEAVYSIHRKFKQFEKQQKLVVFKSSAVRELVMENNEVVGVKTSHQTDYADAVVLASGGFVANAKLLPDDLKRFGTTNGNFASGDGLEMALKVNAGLVDIDKIQLHPTAFAFQKFGEKERLANAQPLCAEIIRGVGGILLNSKGKRFCNELGTRAYVSNKMREQREEFFYIVLSENVAKDAKYHVPNYVERGYLKQIENGVTGLAQELNVEVLGLTKELEKYENKNDEFGKQYFLNSDGFSTSKVYFLGKVQPALHYGMGGLKINSESNVLDLQNRPIKNLYAVGEITGGIHGENRLGGNGMTESVVFGVRLGKRLFSENGSSSSSSSSITGGEKKNNNNKPALITQAFIDFENSQNGKCLIIINELVYDFTHFIEEHPGGSQSILSNKGRNATKQYYDIHPASFLQDFEIVGEYSN